MERKVRSRVGVDVDNVVANSSQTAIDLLNERAGGFNGDPIRRAEVTVRPFHLAPGLQRRGVTQDQVSKAIDDAWRYHFLEISLMEPNIPSTLSMLMQEGISAELITTMGNRDASIRPNLSTWAEAVGLPYDALHFVKTSEEKLGYPFLTIIDDEQQLAVSLAASGRPGIIYPAPWNADFVSLHRSDPNASGLIKTPRGWADTSFEVRMLELAART